MTVGHAEARLAQPAERKELNLVVVGSSPTMGEDVKQTPEGKNSVYLKRIFCYFIFKQSKTPLY